MKSAFLFLHAPFLSLRMALPNCPTGANETQVGTGLFAAGLAAERSPGLPCTI